MWDGTLACSRIRNRPSLVDKAEDGCLRKKHDIVEDAKPDEELHELILLMFAGNVFNMVSLRRVPFAKIKHCEDLVQTSLKHPTVSR